MPTTLHITPDGYKFYHAGDFLRLPKDDSLWYLHDFGARGGDFFEDYKRFFFPPENKGFPDLREERQHLRAVATHARTLKPLDALTTRWTQSRTDRVRGRQSVEEFFRRRHEAELEARKIPPVDGVRILSVTE